MKSTTVIVVDDEALIVRQIAETLVAAGYNVIGAAHAEQALERLAVSRGAAALVTDIRLPGMSGWELAREVRRLFPRIAVIYMSGDSAVQWLSESVPSSIILDKPFVASQLLAAVISMLELVEPAILASGSFSDPPQAPQA